MQKSVSITFTFDFVPKLSEYTLFDIGTDKEYFNHQKTIEDFSEQYQSTFKSQLAEIVKACKSKLPLSVYFSQDFILQMKREDSDIIDELGKLAKSKNLEILAGLDRPGLTSIYSEKQLIESIASHRSFMKSMFGVNTTTFYNLENIFWNQLGKQLSSLGFKNTFAGSIDWYLGSNLHQRVFPLVDNNDFNVLLVDTDQTKALFHTPDITNHFLHFNSTQVEELDGVESIIRATSGQGQIIPIGDHKNTGTKPYNIKNPVMGSTQGMRLDSYNGNALQNQILKQYYQLEEAMLATSDAQLKEHWERLGHAAYLHSMSLNEINKKEPYQQYNKLNNMLTDLRIRLEVTS